MPRLLILVFDKIVDILSINAETFLEEKNMEKMILNDNTEIAIKEGAGLSAITAISDNWMEVGIIAEAIKKKGNLDSVRFESDGLETGRYTDLVLESPLFSSIDIYDDKIHTVLSVREKTEIEKRLDAIESGQYIRDGAIMELAGMIGGE